ncbi:MAG: 16S rRNA (guanine(527)-N(7))-methyltransferase RsmG [Alphaproteobacteria bacterium]
MKPMTMEEFALYAHFNFASDAHFLHSLPFNPDNVSPVDVSRETFSPAESLSPEPSVSRETLERLQALIDLLTKWQKTVNLVGLSTLTDPWRRHILDSAQLLPYLKLETLSSNSSLDRSPPQPPGKPPGKPLGPIADLGSGAGFPGLVLSILGVENIILIESDARKAAFIREATRIVNSSARVLNQRIETVTETFPLIVARALAPLDKLLILAKPLLSSPGVCLFPKGADADKELTTASERWRFSKVESFASITDPKGRILRLIQPQVKHVPGKTCP